MFTWICWRINCIIIVLKGKEYWTTKYCVHYEKFRHSNVRLISTIEKNVYIDNWMFACEWHNCLNKSFLLWHSFCSVRLLLKTLIWLREIFSYLYSINIVFKSFLKMIMIKLIKKNPFFDWKSKSLIWKYIAKFISPNTN